MSLWVIVPVKPLNRAKSRLAEVLSPQARSEFAEVMLRHVLTQCAKVPQVTGTLVISRDPKALSIARDLGAKTIQESSPSDLNPALMRATQVIRMWGAGAALVLPADLPFITATDISEIAELGLFGPCVVLAPDRENDGTNAMLVRPPGLIDYRYGPGSYKIHMDAAIHADARVKYYESEALQLDIDVPLDLDMYNERVAADQSLQLPLFLPDMTPE